MQFVMPSTTALQNERQATIEPGCCIGPGYADFFTGAAHMITNYVLIDFENVQVKSLALLKGKEFKVFVFVGKTNNKLPFGLVNDIQKFGDRGEYVKLESSGPNALDFHIAFYLGKLVTNDATGVFHVISKDRGFDTLIHRLNTQGVEATRVPTIEEMPCFAAITLNATAAPATPVQTVQAAKPKKSPVVRKVASKVVKSAELDASVTLVIENLIARTKARPVKMKSLVNTINNLIGKDRPVAEAEAVRDVLVARKYVVEDGLKVTYKLPKTD